MIKISTPHDLIRYIYGETNKKETIEIENAILCDNQSHMEFNELIKLKHDLDQVKQEPSNGVISKIMDYSRSFEMPQLIE